MADREAIGERYIHNMYIHAYKYYYYHSVSVSLLTHFPVSVVLVIFMHFHAAYVYILKVHMLHATNVLKHLRTCICVWYIQCHTVEAKLHK